MKTIHSFLVAFLLLSSLQAQIPIRYFITPVKGNVLKKEEVTFPYVYMSPDGKPMFSNNKEKRSLLIYDKGRPSKRYQYVYDKNQQEKLQLVVQYTYTKDLISKVEEFKPHPSIPDSLVLEARFLPKYENGQIVSEEIMDGEGNLLGKLEYLKNVAPLIVYDEYRQKEGKLTKGNRYGCQYDQKGLQILNFETDGADTIKCVRTKVLNDSITQIRLYTKSRGEYQEVKMIHFKTLDQTGNPVEQSFKMLRDNSYYVLKTRYQYQGQADWPPEPEEKETLFGPEEPPAPMEVVVAPDAPIREYNPNQPKVHHLPYQPFEVEGKFGCKDSHSNTIVPAIYDQVMVYDRSATLFLVQKGNAWGAMNLDGELVLPIQYRSINPGNGSYKLQTLDYKYGMADLKGNIVIPCIYDLLSWNVSPNQEFIQASLDGKAALYHNNGQAIFPLEYQEYRASVHKKTPFAVKKEGKWGLIELNGATLIPFKYDNLNYFHIPLQNRDPKEALLLATLNGKTGIIDRFDQPLISISYEQLEISMLGTACIAEKNGKKGIIDLNEKTLLPFQYKRINMLTDTLFIVVNEAGFSGAWSATKEIIPEIFPADSVFVNRGMNYLLMAHSATEKWLYSPRGDFKPFKYERQQILNYMGHIYHVSDDKKCIISVWNNAQTPYIEWFNTLKTVKIGKSEYLELQNKDSKGNIQYGLRTAFNGESIAPTELSELIYTITDDQKQLFQAKFGRNAMPLVIGKKTKTDPGILFGSGGKSLDLN